MKMTTPTSLEIQRACPDSGLPTDAQLTRWTEAALKGAGVTQAGEITLRLVEADESQALNAEYRQRDYPTNVLSFPFEMPEGLPAQAAPDILGDLVICAEVVAREASEQEKHPEAHWAHMVVHGVLHLLGYDHQSDEQADNMETLEKQILASLGYNDPYQE